MPRCKLIPDERVGAIGMLETGVNQINITDRVNVAQSVISILYTRLYQTGSSGRPRKNTKNRYLLLRASRDPTVSSFHLRYRDAGQI